MGTRLQRQKNTWKQQHRAGARSQHFARKMDRAKGGYSSEAARRRFFRDTSDFNRWIRAQPIENLPNTPSKLSPNLTTNANSVDVYITGTGWVPPKRNWR